MTNSSLIKQNGSLFSIQPTCRWMAILLLAVAQVAVGEDTKKPEPAPAIETALTLIPPSPVTNRIQLEIRGSVHNTTEQEQEYEVGLYWDRIAPESRITGSRITVKPGQRRLVQHTTPTTAHSGDREIIMVAKGGEQKSQVSQSITVLDSKTRSPGRICGAWLGIYHWCDVEGAPWNEELKKMTDAQWKELVRAMHEVGMNIIVLQEVFRNEARVGEHDLTVENYPGLAFYPSELYPGRVPIAAKDPVEAILAEASRLGMHVFVAVGNFAWFDFGPESLRWHLRVADELWERYGHHESFYGWYISAEIEGGLSAGARDEPTMKLRHDQIVHFFSEFRRHVDQYAPDKPVMLATNSHGIDAGEHVYPGLLANLDILSPFGFHRMPAGDTTGEVAAARLQKLCDEAGSHLWMDMEIFDFGPNGLIPRSIDGLMDDLNRFPVFEKILCYQFPGLMNAPWMSRHPGGPTTVKLFNEYKERLETGRLVPVPVDHLANGLGYRLAHEPSPQYPGKEEFPLTDGWLGLANYQHSAWVGFEGEPLDLELDFPEPRKISEVEIGFLQDHASGIFLPSSVRVGISADGEQYQWFDAERSADGAERPIGRHAYTAKFEGVETKFLRVTTSSSGVVPDGHPAAGTKMWTFADELIIRK